MTDRYLAGLIVLVGAALIMPQGATGQTPGRTPWGDPDLQGTWTNTTETRLQRPDDLATDQVLTAEERAARDQARVARHEAPPREGSPGNYNYFWLERGQSTSRPSLIVDPPDGRLPALTPAAHALADALRVTRDSPSYPTTWEEPSVFERCITRGMPATMMPGFYNHNYQILQAPGYVAIVAEMIHDARIIPLDDRPHLPEHVRQWMGDSRGRWEGDTLVVETTNFTDKVTERRRSNAVFGASEAMYVVERFTRVDEDALDYRFTVTDPTTFAAPWTAWIPMTSMDVPLFEYACHEGNYAMPNMLRGARLQETAMATR